MVLNALFKLRNIGILVVVFALLSVLGSASALPALLGIAWPAGLTWAGSLAVYIAFVIQTLLSREFQNEFNQKEKFRKIRELNRLANRLAGEAKRNTNNTYLLRLRKVMEDKNDIFASYSNGEHSYLKEKIVEQTLSLVIAYLKLLNNFCIRNRELSSVDVGAISTRINTNNRKLSFARDARMADDIRKIIDMDTRLIERMKEEKKDLERISARLDYMESTVNMFKHQIMSSIESEDMLEQLETAVNEAEALDAVLDERRRSRLRL